MQKSRNRAREIFEELLGSRARSPETVLKICAGDASLADEVYALLDAFQSAQFLDSPFGCQSSHSPIQRLQIGDFVGSYQLVELIGTGGFGEVFRAVQQDPMVREVAIKIVKRGMDSGKLLERFSRERQVLALLDHPFIAGIIEAGSANTGQPYFVMEYISGTSLTDFADDKNLSVRERVQLVVDICDAIRHAHQKGIIHRDLKPTNILVYENDTQFSPKVIDFGIAKTLGYSGLTNQQLTVEFTLIGSPHYMSPEQATRSKDIDTRTDIYSVGAILYELLSGHTVLDQPDDYADEFDSIEDQIIRGVAIRPSERFKKSNKADLIAANRSTSIVRLENELAGDLDSIVMMAVQNDKNCRYQSVTSLSNDLQKYLDGLPVMAHPPKFSYLARKWFNRNRLAFYLISTCFLALVFAAGFSLVMARFANHHEEQAKEALEESEEQKRLLSDSHDRIKKLVRHFFSNNKSGDRTKIEIEYEALLSLIDDLHVLDAALIRGLIGRDWCQLGMYEKALEQLQLASIDWERHDREFDISNLLAKSKCAYAFTRLDRFSEAESMAHSVLNDLHNAQGDNLEYRMKLCEYESCLALARSLGAKGNDRVAKEWIARSLSIAKSLNKTEWELQARFEGMGLYSESSPRVALINAKRIYQDFIDKFGIQAIATLKVHHRLGWLYYKSGELERSRKIIDSNLIALKGSLPKDHPFLIGALLDDALIRKDPENLERVLQSIRESGARLSYEQERLAYLAQASLMLSQKRYQEAAKLRESTYVRSQKTFGNESVRTLEDYFNLSAVYLEIGLRSGDREMLERAERILDDGLEQITGKNGYSFRRRQQWQCAKFAVLVKKKELEKAIDFGELLLQEWDSRQEENRYKSHVQSTLQRIKEKQADGKK